MVKDFAAFLDALNSEDADYAVIGGFAVISYIPYRTTRDIDVLIEPSLENAAKVRRAVETWGEFEPDFAVEDFIAMKKGTGRAEKDRPDVERLVLLKKKRAE